MSAVEGWIKTQLGEIATLVKGISYASEDYCGAGEGAVFITIKCVSKAGGFKREGIKYFKGSIAPSQVLQPGELLIANTDLTRAGDIVGCPMVVPIMSGEIITMSMDLSKIVEDDAKIDRNFLYYKLMTDSVRHFMKDHASGSTVLHLQTRAVPDLELEIPTSKPEQTKIAQILSTVDRAIEQTEALITKQQRIKTGLMQDLLTRGIDEHGNLRSEQTHEFRDSPLGRIPVEWEVGGFDNYVINDAGIKPGPFGSSLTKDMHVQAGYRVYGQEQVIGGTLDIGDYFISERKFTEMAGFAVRAGDVLISLVGTIGHVLIVPKGHHPGVINPRLLRFRPYPRHCLPEFLRVLLLSQPVRLQLDTFATGGTMPVLSAGIIRKLCVVVIGVDEQARIIQTIGKSEECILSSSESLNKLSSLKTALMQDLLTGKKRVTALLTRFNENDNGKGVY